MNIKQAKEKVKAIVQNTTLVPALLGERGIGKTESLKQVAQELGWAYQAIYPSSLEGPDFMGLVVKDMEAGMTRYLAPEFLPVEQAVERGLFPDKGLLVIEEFNRAETQTIHTLYPLLLERRINTHKIHDGWKLAVAMNPDTVQYTTVSIDMAALDRLLIINVEPNIDEYIDYCIESGEYDRDVLDFLNAYPQMLLQTDASQSSDTLGKSPSPRAWTFVQWLRTKAGLGLRADDAGDVDLIAGLVGMKATTAMLGYLRDAQFRPIPASKIIDSPNEAMKELERILSAGRFDVLNVTLRELVQALPINNQKKLEGIEPFILMLPNDLKTMFAKLLQTSRRNAFLKVITAWPQFKVLVTDAVVRVASAF